MDLGLALGYALFVWWFATGVILYLDGLPSRTYPVTMLGASVLAGAGLFAIYGARDDGSSLGAYHAFTGALAVWGWNEVAFLIGWITGPRRRPATPGVRGFRRVVEASEMILWHEVAIAAGFAAILAASWGGENMLGVQTYVLLWAMRLSAKLNIFLGVPHAPVSFLPEHLRHLASCFRERSMNFLFPVSVTLSTGALALLGWRAATAPATGEGVAFALLAVFMALAILEHWFLVLPWPSEKLWKWGMRSHLTAKTPLAGVPVTSYADAQTKGSL
jgi:putative photosynthetic complex assembly protein 2